MTIEIAGYDAQEIICEQLQVVKHGYDNVETRGALNMAKLLVNRLGDQKTKEAFDSKCNELMDAVSDFEAKYHRIIREMNIIVAGTAV